MPRIGDIRRLQRRDWLIIVGLTALAALARLLYLHHPVAIVFDETYFANFAHDYLTGQKFFDAEPPLAKFLIAGGEKLFGSDPGSLAHPFGWRIAPALFGTAVIPLMYLFAKKLFGGVVVPTLAAVFALLDGLLLVESRVAVIDIFVVFFNLLTYLLFLMHLQAKDRSRSILWLVATGVALGLGLAVKWITLAFLAPAVLVLLMLYLSKKPWLKRLFRARSAAGVFGLIGADPKNLHHPFVYIVLLGVLPAGVYTGLFSLHVPHDSTGEGIYGIHRQIFNYHHNLTATHPYGSEWYTWPFLLRPVAYYFNATNGQWSGILALGNPILWWGGVLAVVYAAYELFKRRSFALLIILAAIVAHYGPWSIIGRVLFIYHYLGALPFVFLALAYAGGRSWEARPKDLSAQLFGWVLLTAAIAAVAGMLGWSLAGNAVGGLIAGGVVGAVATMTFAGISVGKLSWGQKQVIAFVALAVLVFGYFLPIWTGIPLDPTDYGHHLWLRRWL